ncbi:hypothetical protein DFH28DRAFT_1016626 [Melampsora americana]|nr:hypothetical protein DFH28DRAFT_1016626 [Melampsora americana]
MHISLSYAAAGIVALLTANFEGTDARMGLSTRHTDAANHQRRSQSKRAPSTIRPRATSDYIPGRQEPTLRDAFQTFQPASTTTSPERQSSYSHQWGQPSQLNGFPIPGAPLSALSSGGLPVRGVSQSLAPGLKSALPLGTGGPENSSPFGVGGIGNDLSPLGVGRLANALPLGGSDSSYGLPLTGSLPSTIHNLQGPSGLLGFPSLSSPINRVVESPANLPSPFNPNVPLFPQTDGSGFVDDTKIDGILHHIKHSIDNSHIAHPIERPVSTPNSYTQQTPATQVSPQANQVSQAPIPFVMPVRSATSPVDKNAPQAYNSPHQQAATFVTPIAAQPVADSNYTFEQPQALAQSPALPVTQKQIASPSSENQPDAYFSQEKNVSPAASRPIAPFNIFEQPQAPSQPIAAQPSTKQNATPALAAQSVEAPTHTPQVPSAAKTPSVSQANQQTDKYANNLDSPDLPVVPSTGRTNVPSNPNIGTQSQNSPMVAPQKAMPVSTPISSPARAVQGTTAAASSPVALPRDSYY